MSLNIYLKTLNFIIWGYGESTFRNGITMTKYLLWYFIQSSVFLVLPAVILWEERFFPFFLSLVAPHVELPQAGIELTATAVEVQSLKCWTTREALGIVFSREWNTGSTQGKRQTVATRALGTIERAGTLEAITQQGQLAINITGSWGICFLWRFLAGYKFLWIGVWSGILTHILHVP